MVKIPAGQPSNPEALRALALLESLRTGSEETDVLEAFEQLDALPADVVRGILETWTGPSPDPSSLDASVRRKLGFPPAPLDLQCVRADHPAAGRPLHGTAEEQIRIAGQSWDGKDLDAQARLSKSSGEASFAGRVEVRSFVERVTGRPKFDVVLHGEGNGEIFRAGSTTSVGHVADGIVELKDRVARDALQQALNAEVEPISAAPSTQPEIPPSSAPITERTPTTRAPRETAEARVEPVVTEVEAVEAAEAPRPRKVAAKRKAAAVVVDEAAETAKVPAAKKKAAAKKTTAKAGAKKATAVKKTAAKKATAKNTTAKKVAAKAGAKKATAKKATAKKATAKKATAKKATAVKKTAAKKATAKKVAAKKTTAKKNAAKKTAAKKTAKATKKASATKRR